ncbi:MAG TPA: ATP-binding cassette domain-containing protein [Ktedonobacteraceae bacterium]
MAGFGSHNQRYITGPLGKQARPCVIAFDHLSTARHERLGLQDISLSIYEGESVAVIGPAGSGKSTLLACIQGLVQPLVGHLHVMGVEVPPMTAVIRRQIGVMPGTLDHPEMFRMADLVKRFAGYYDLDLSESQVEEYCRHYALSSSALVSQLTLPERRVLLLALALVHDPHLVLLDEPLAGLSHTDGSFVWPYLRRMQSEGRTLLTTFTPPIAEEHLREYDVTVMLDRGHIQSPKSEDG